MGTLIIHARRTSHRLRMRRTVRSFLSPRPSCPNALPTRSLRRSCICRWALWRSAWSLSSLAGTPARSCTWAAVAMAVGMAGMMVGQIARGRGDRKVKLNGLRRDYLRYLSQVRLKARRAAAAAAAGHGVFQPGSPERCRLWSSGGGCGSAPLQTATSSTSGSPLAPRRWRCVWCRRRPSPSRISTRSARRAASFIRSHSQVPFLPVVSASALFHPHRFLGDSPPSSTWSSL